MTTAATLTIGGDDVAANTNRIDVWHKVNSVSRMAIQLDNRGGTYNGTFNPQEVIDIGIAGADILDGWVDNVHPMVDQEPDVFTQNIEVLGRDYSRELVDLTVDKYYGLDGANLYYGLDIVDDMLSTASSNITYTSPASGTRMTFDAKESYLLDNFRAILVDRLDYDWYVDTAKALQTFAIGTQASGITLSSVAGGGSNNILSLEWDNSDGTNIKNYILIKGKKIKDVWSEFNASDYTVPTNASASDDSSAVAGLGSIKFTKSTATSSYLQLDFSGTLYGRTNIDWSALDNGNITFQIKQDTVDSAFLYYYIKLYDDAGTPNEIEWQKWQSNLSVNFLDDARWVEFSFPVGPNVELPQGSSSVDWWQYAVGTSFSWKVTKIEIGAVCVAAAPVDEFYIDGLDLPAYAQSVAQDATSQSSYGVRKMILSKPNVESQRELDAISADILAKRKDPIKILRIIAQGSAGIISSANKWLPGYTVTVNVPGEGISSESWRIVEAHHIWAPDEPLAGNDYYVEVKLTPNADKLDMRRYEQLYEDVAILRDIREYVRWLEEQEDAEIKYPAPPAPIGDLYLLSSHMWNQWFEAEGPRITKSDGSTTIQTDATATGGKCIQRLTAAGSGNMWTTEAIEPRNDMTGKAFVWFRLKTNDISSADSFITLEVYNNTAASVTSSVTLAPDDFGANNVWEAFGLSFEMILGHAYLFRGSSFVTGKADLNLDWIGVTSFAIPMATSGLTVDAAATGLNNSAAATGLNNSAAATGLDNSAAATGLANTATGDHNHSANSGGPSNTSTYWLVAGINTLYAASVSGGSPTTAFTAITSYASVAVPTAAHTHPVNVLNDGAHNHGHGADSHNTGHGADSHGTGHGADSHGTGHGADSHPHTSTEGKGHDH